MNLFWLKYVSYAFLIVALIFYSLIRLNRPGLSTRLKVVLYCFCIVSASLSWHVQESNAAQHSPRKLVIGTVATVSVDRHKGGDIEDEFQLQLEGGSQSPKFSTDTVAESEAAQPIHTGDLLGVLYRTWDNVPLTIDEIEGQQRGWHYQRTNNGNAYVFGVSLVGFVSLLAALFAGRRARSRAAQAETE